MKAEMVWRTLVSRGASPRAAAVGMKSWVEEQKD